MYHEQSIAFCSSWFRWLVKEMDPFMQWKEEYLPNRLGVLFSLMLLTNEEYERERYEREKAHKERQELDYRFAGKNSSSPVVHSERISEEKPGWLVEDIMANIMKQQTLDEEDEKYMKMFLEGASRGVTSKHALKIALETYGLKMLISRMKKQEKPDYFKTPKELE
eukprot:jgi/Galph1/1494/GphlegSOOS_G171.1